MKKNWKNILFTLLTLVSGLCIYLVWISEFPLIFKIFDIICLIGLPIWNTIVINKTIKK